MYAQHISDFSSLTPQKQDEDFHIPDTYTFQYIIEEGATLTEGGNLPDNCDFAGYVPIHSSSKFGYLSINSESVDGGVTILDIELDEEEGRWKINRSEKVVFTFGLMPSLNINTTANCSGAITPWNTIITCEEYTSKEIKNRYSSIVQDSWVKVDGDLNGYDGFGWAIEIDPISKTVIHQDGGRNGQDKLWAMGNFKHENAVVHDNLRTVYQGADDTVGEGFLFKFVADFGKNLSSGKLYVFKEIDSSTGEWIELANSTINEQNSTLAQCDALGATSFAGIEDVDISPIDGKIYFAVKGDGKVYRFKDSDALTGTTISEFETYVGGISYNLNNGSTEPWGMGNDNLVFDDLGNLWVAQDGSDNHIWVVENGHTQQNPKVKIFARTPFGSEPTGLTFSPDYKYLFMSIQHPDANNSTTTQPDAFGEQKAFNKDAVLVIARNEYLANDLTVASSKDILISQYYSNEINGSKWVELVNISDKVIPAGYYFLELYDQSELATIENSAPTFTQPIPKMEVGEVILFKNSNTPATPNAANLGLANQFISPVCNFDGDDVLLISSTAGNLSYKNRRDIFGDINGNTLGTDNTFIRGGSSLEIPEKFFIPINWLELSIESDVNSADNSTNIALGTQAVGLASWNGSSWVNLFPDRTRNVEITSGIYDVTNRNLEAYNLTIAAGAHLNFTNDNPNTKNSVIVYNDLSIDGILTIGDDESLVMYDDQAIITGVISKIEKSALINNIHDITYWSSPITNAILETIFSEVNPNRKFAYDQSKSSISDPQEDDGTYWDVWTIATGKMIPGYGYAIESPEGQLGIHTVIFEGQPNNGEISYDLKGNFTDTDSDNDFNLIGNPYPSAIDLDLFFEENANYLKPEDPLEATAYFWTHATPVSETGDFAESDYATYNLTGGTGVQGVDIPTGNIGSSQGFFVRAINPGTIVFNNTMRIKDANDQFFKLNSAKKSEGDLKQKNRIWINLTTNQGGFNQLLLGFNEESTPDFDRGFDALKFDGGNPISFYSILENQKLAIQNLGSLSEGQEIELGFDSTVAPRTFSISIFKDEGKLKDLGVYLVDRKLNVIHDLRENDYHFEQTTSGSFPDRFVLQFFNAALLSNDFTNTRSVIVSNSNDEFHIRATNDISDIKIYDIFGRLLIQNNPHEKFIRLKNNINLGTILVFQVTLENGVILNKKIIKY